MARCECQLRNFIILTLREEKRNIPLNNHITVHRIPEPRKKKTAIRIFHKLLLQCELVAPHHYLRLDHFLAFFAYLRAAEASMLLIKKIINNHQAVHKLR